MFEKFRIQNVQSNLVTINPYWRMLLDMQQAASSPDFAFQPYSHVSASPRECEEALQDCCSCYNP